MREVVTEFENWATKEVNELRESFYCRPLIESTSYSNSISSVNSSLSFDVFSSTVKLHPTRQFLRTEPDLTTALSQMMQFSITTLQRQFIIFRTSSFDWSLTSLQLWHYSWRSCRWFLFSREQRNLFQRPSTSQKFFQKSSCPQQQRNPTSGSTWW